ncbi:alpha-galactosidase [Vibrio breoganii]|uniref:alpha-galactosidase n=1 Tax=Vibrio breoganii TaxID=553239 RepID=UPI000C84065D|nr:alpha-galactosidase [Vibrio breoganii]PMF78682.1 alpha-galactosidase [Vibrio breoganii]PMM20440.1 alpha-galactosidase [Vibrio breoganii]PMO64814.1 alpha-galactosidase [Vibrio breoganii]
MSQELPQEFVQLNSQVSSLIVRLLPAPEIVYWGKAIPTLTSEAEFSAIIDRAISQARLDVDVPVTLCPEIGRGSFGASGLEGHHQGKNWAPVFQYVSHTLTGECLTVECADKLAKLSIKIDLILDGQSGVLSESISLTNHHEADYQLEKLVLTIPIPYRAKEVMSFSGRWSREFQAQRHSIEHGVFTQENRRGRTSHEYFPGCIVGNKAFTHQIGEVWGFHLGWSGNHHWRAEAKSDGRRFIQAGELLMPGEVSLKQGESYTSPTLYASYSCSGLNGLRQANHNYVRQNILVLEQDKPRPVHLNTWEGIYFEHDPDYICQMASEAAQMGVERFIIDDGWFKGRNNDKAALGDWTLDKTKYPKGLNPVIEHINKLDMEFGIWVEPEMVNPDSDLFRVHPEWVLSTSGYPLTTGRNQLVLNLQIPECFDYLYRCLDDLLSQNNIAYIKWDMNRELLQPSHEEKAGVRGQTLAFYHLVDKLRVAHPEVEIESCSSGGGRMDYEVLKRTHRFWSSDCNDALERQTIQQNMSLFFPPEILGTHIGPAHSHTTRRQHSINFRGVTALFGHMGVELDPVKESEQERRAFARYIELHKQHRTLLHSGHSFVIDSCEATRNTYGVYDDTQLLLVICQKAMPDYSLPEPVLLDMLDENASYQLSLLELPEHGEGIMKHYPNWIEQLRANQEVKVHGSVLKQVGLALPIQDPETCLLLHFAKCED